MNKDLLKNQLSEITEALIHLTESPYPDTRIGNYNFRILLGHGLKCEGMRSSGIRSNTSCKIRINADFHVGCL